MNINSNGIIFNAARDFTKITMKNENGDYTIKVPHIQMNIGDVVQELIIPILKAVGYGEKGIDRWIDME